MIKQKSEKFITFFVDYFPEKLVSKSPPQIKRINKNNSDHSGLNIGNIHSKKYFLSNWNIFNYCPGEHCLDPH